MEAHCILFLTVPCRTYVCTRNWRDDQSENRSPRTFPTCRIHLNLKLFKKITPKISKVYFLIIERYFKYCLRRNTRPSYPCRVNKWRKMPASRSVFIVHTLIGQRNPRTFVRPWSSVSSSRPTLLPFSSVPCSPSMASVSDTMLSMAASL